MADSVCVVWRLQLVKLVVVGPISMLSAALQWAGGSLRIVWAALLALVSALRSGWRAMSAVQQGTWQVGEQVRQPPASCSCFAAGNMCLIMPDDCEHVLHCTGLD